MRSRTLVTFAWASAAVVALSLVGAPAQAATDRTSYSSVAASAHAAGVKAAAKKGRVVEEKYTGGALPVSGKSWYVSLRSKAVTRTVTGSSQGGAAYAAAAAARLKKLGLTKGASFSDGGGTATAYTSAKVRCVVVSSSWSGSLACGAASSVSSAAKKVAPFAAAYAAKNRTAKGIAFGVPKAEAGSAGYTRATGYAGDVTSQSGAMMYYSKAPGKKWTWLTGSQATVDCSVFEATVASSRAWSGEPCLRGSETSRVVAQAGAGSSSAARVTTAAHASGLAAAEKKARKTVSSWGDNYADFRVPGKAWYVWLTSKVTSRLAYADVSASRGAQMRAAYVSASGKRLKALGLRKIHAYSEGGHTLITYRSSTVQCSIASSRFTLGTACAPLSAVTAAANTANPFITSLSKKSPVYKGSSFSTPTTIEGMTGYLRGEIGVHLLGELEGGSLLFARTSEVPWDYLAASGYDLPADCAPIEATVIGSRAWAGEQCLRGESGLSTVAPR
jgi:hypothetical protein